MAFCKEVASRCPVFSGHEKSGSAQVAVSSLCSDIRFKLKVILTEEFPARRSADWRWRFPGGGGEGGLASGAGYKRGVCSVCKSFTHEAN